MIDKTRLIAAYETARERLLESRVSTGSWVGCLASSALATATAVSALSIVKRQMAARHSSSSSCGSGFSDQDEKRLGSLILNGVQWLANEQNGDGGWGDTDQSHSNIATTMLAIAAFELTGVPAEHADLLDRARQYVQCKGGTAALRKRYGKDKTFAVPILTNCALAGSVNWNEVSPLPFELACLPQRFYRLMRLPVVSYAIPALVSVGQARYFFRRPWNPLTRLLRGLTFRRGLNVLAKMQPESGGYLEAIPLTSFVVMCLAATGRADQAVTQNGVRFLLDTVRPDGSWPIDTNLATWNTTQAVNALAVNGSVEDDDLHACSDLLLEGQQTTRHPFTGAQPGGWGWSDLSGAVPDADDTASALLTLATASRLSNDELRQASLQWSAINGRRWLIELQNRDGGWPTFCRGWGKLPFDRSGSDLTAHAIRALHAWRQIDAEGEADRAIRRGFSYLKRNQSEDGSWTPLWFGNQDHPDEENPVYGTAKVLLAYRDLGRTSAQSAKQGAAWLMSSQQADGGWGPGTASGCGPSSMEETALAVEALLAFEPLASATLRGLTFLMEAVESGRFEDASPIGLYFAKLWYYETLYPNIFVTSALGHAAITYDAANQALSEPMMTG